MEKSLQGFFSTTRLCTLLFYRHTPSPVPLPSYHEAATDRNTASTPSSKSFYTFTTLWIWKQYMGIYLQSEVTFQE